MNIKYILIIHLTFINNLINGFFIDFTNNCDHDIDLYNNTNTCIIKKNKIHNCKTYINKSWNNMFRHGESPFATLAEFSFDGFNEDEFKSKVWYDISLVHPSNDINSTFNVPLQIKVLNNENIEGYRCKTLTCLEPNCEDAYLFFNDDIKTHSCPNNTNFEVIFCPMRTKC